MQIYTLQKHNAAMNGKIRVHNRIKRYQGILELLAHGLHIIILIITYYYIRFSTIYFQTAILFSLNT